MNPTLYKFISSAVIIIIWLYLAISGFMEYRRLMKAQGNKSFTAHREIAQFSDLESSEAIQRWIRAARRLFLIWMVSAISFMAISIIIERTIGLK